MQLIKTMLVKSLHHFVLDLNLLLNFLHNVLLKYQFITVRNLTIFSKNLYIIKQIGSSSQDKPVYGTTYLHPLIIIPKGDCIKCVLDARHLNSNTEQSDESWPIKPLAPQLARANKKYKSAIDLMYACAHTPLDEDTIKLTSFSSGDNSLLLYEASVVSKDFQTSLQNKCLPSLKPS